MALGRDEDKADDSHDGPIFDLVKIMCELSEYLAPHSFWQFVSFDFVLLIVDDVFEDFHDLVIVHFFDELLEVLDAEGVDVFVDGGGEAVFDRVEK